jgi:hypothetical protein
MLQGTWLRKLNEFCNAGRKDITDVLKLASTEYMNIIMQADDDDVDEEDVEEEEDKEDERKVCYVGLTRARTQLIITYVDHINFENRPISRFIGYDVNRQYLRPTTFILEKEMKQTYNKRVQKNLLYLTQATQPTQIDNKLSQYEEEDITLNEESDHRRIIVEEEQEVLCKDVQNLDENYVETEANDSSFLLSPVQNMDELNDSQFFPNSNKEVDNTPAVINSSSLKSSASLTSPASNELELPKSNSEELVGDKLPTGANVIRKKKKPVARSKDKFVSLSEQKATAKSASVLQNWVNKAKRSSTDNDSNITNDTHNKENELAQSMPHGKQPECTTDVEMIHNDEISPKRKREQEKDLADDTEKSENTPPQKRVRTNVLTCQSKTKTKSGTTVLRFGPTRPDVPVINEPLIDLNEYVIKQFNNTAQGLVFTIGQECNHCKTWIPKEVIEKRQADETPTISCPICDKPFEPNLIISYPSPNKNQSTAKAQCELYNEGLTRAKAIELSSSEERYKLYDNTQLLKNYPSLFWNLLHKFGCVHDAREMIINEHSKEQLRKQEEQCKQQAEKKDHTVKKRNSTSKKPQKSKKEGITKKSKTSAIQKGQKDLFSFIKKAS